MVNHVVPVDKLEAATQWLAKRIAINSTCTPSRSPRCRSNQAADIMGQSAAVRASGNFWMLAGERADNPLADAADESEPSIHDRVDWSKNRNKPFEDMDEKPW